MGLRETFGEDAELYDRVRPSYPVRLYDEIARMLGAPVARPRVLEIGCGTGQATAPMIRRGWSVKAVELSPTLGAVARDKLPELEVIVADFDTWPLPAERFDLVLSATAFHWLDPETRVAKAADALRPGGVLAVVSTHHVAGGSEQFWIDVQDCYERFTGKTRSGGLPAGDTVSSPTADELAVSGRFGPANVWRHEWELTYTTAEYLDLLSSYSGHRALTEQARDGLYNCIRALIDASGGSVTKRYLSLLTAANRLHQPLALG
ncbi:class I SAM-dependent methyltransferase [Kribbella sp. NPDC051770]|uniref:class I SAM-dependent methyltransferase n=1 Tax=Kribbella sp. NPDC051770 TaxID=3155413 RepID=UPI00341D2D37